MGRVTRGWTPNDLYNKKYESYELSERFADAFGSPEKNGVWFIWGDSGSGKSSFTAQLAKELTRFGRVVYNSLEEGNSAAMKEVFMRAGLKKGIILVQESIAELSKRLSRPKSPQIVIIDSFQYTGLSFKAYLEMKEAHRNKHFIIISQADGKRPDGRTARRVMFDATLKIWIEGYTAFSKGRTIGRTGEYVIWDEGAALYWGQDKLERA